MPKEVNKLAENMRRMFMMFFKGRESIMDFMKKSKHVSSCLLYTSDAADE